MANVGPTLPSTAVDNGGGSTVWSNPDNVKASNDTYATASLGTISSFSNYIKVTNFGFSIPTSATINGVVVEVERKGTGPDITDRNIRLVVSDVINGDSKPSATVWGSEATENYGGASDLWGLALTRANVVASNFGVAVSCKHIGGFSTASIDSIKMTVHYTADTAREAKGTILLGGTAVRLFKSIRSSQGTILLGGTATAFIRRNTDVLETKRFLYKVYEEDGSFVEIWKDVITEPTYSQEINEIGSTMSLELARNSDSLGISTTSLLDSNNAVVTDSNTFSILTTTDQPNQVGPGSSINHNNRVDVSAFYGSTQSLLDSDNNEILDSNNEPIITTLGAPNGRIIFTGFIAEIGSRYGSTETTTVQLMSYGYDLQQFPVITSGGNTTVPFLSVDPSALVRTALTQFATDSALFGTYTTFNNSTIQDTGTVISYTFRANTYAEVLKRA